MIAWIFLWIMRNMTILYYITSNFISKIIINQRYTWFDTIVITILDITYSWYYNIVENMAHYKIMIACQLLEIMKSMSMHHYIASNRLSEIIINQTNSWFGTIVITILDLSYIRYYKLYRISLTLNKLMLVNPYESWRVWVFYSIYHPILYLK